MRKIGLIAMTLVLALGAMGTGFALWSDSLFIEGTIETGDIGLVWTVDNLPFDNEAPEKDVSHAESTIAGNTLIITIFNAYPCITYTIPFDLHGIGSVPVHMALIPIPGNINQGWVTAPNMDGVQLHEGQGYDGEIIVHLDNSAEENATYTFAFELYYWQYNELPIW